jgi:cobalt-zinc-cadmium efflux system protein
MSQLPEMLRDDMRRAKRLERWTLFWMATVVLVMYFTMGSSQAMKTAFIEDALSLLPAVIFLISARLEPKEPTGRFPYGFVRVHGLAFLAAAVVLTFVGLFLLFESLKALLTGEHPTIGPIRLFGETIWLGWVMIAALAYSVIPPVILGRLKKPIAERMRDKVLHTDALMQKADWQTGLAGIAGVLGIAFGLWWADSAAAAFISLSILKDGVSNLRTASAELAEGAPRELDSQDIAREARQIRERLEQRWPEGRVRLRESGRYIIASIDGVPSPQRLPRLEQFSNPDAPWRLTRLTFSPPDQDSDTGEQSGASEQDRDERAGE